MQIKKITSSVVDVFFGQEGYEPEEWARVAKNRFGYWKVIQTNGGFNKAYNAFVNNVTYINKKEGCLITEFKPMTKPHEQWLIYQVRKYVGEV